LAKGRRYHSNVSMWEALEKISGWIAHVLKPHHLWAIVAPGVWVLAEFLQCQYIGHDHNSEIRSSKKRQSLVIYIARNCNNCRWLTRAQAEAGAVRQQNRNNCLLDVGVFQAERDFLSLFGRQLRENVPLESADHYRLTQPRLQLFQIHCATTQQSSTIIAVVSIQTTKYNPLTVHPPWGTGVIGLLKAWQPSSKVTRSLQWSKTRLEDPR